MECKENWRVNPVPQAADTGSEKGDERGAGAMEAPGRLRAVRGEGADARKPRCPQQPAHPAPEQTSLLRALLPLPQKHPSRHLGTPLRLSPLVRRQVVICRLDDLGGAGLTSRSLSFCIHTMGVTSPLPPAPGPQEPSVLPTGNSCLARPLLDASDSSAAPRAVPHLAEAPKG